MAKFWLVLEFINRLFKSVTRLIDYIWETVESRRKRNEDERELRRQDAMEDLKEAQTEKEAMDAQKAIVENQP